MPRDSLQSVLIVTQKFDPHADSLIKLFKQRDVSFFRLNTDDFHADLTTRASSDGGDILFSDRYGRSHSFPSQTRSVWHRKPIDPAPLPGVRNDESKKVILQETLEYLSYPGAIDGPRWVNNPLANQRAQRKFPQLRLAQQLGLRIPRTLITNDPAEARSFQRQIAGPLLCKSMKAQAFASEGTESFIFSRKMTADELEQNIEQIAHCPTLLQEYIEKDHELRVTVIGDALFCCRIDSQTVDGARADWRQVDPFTVPHAIVDLEPATAAKLKQMLAHHDLRYGAFDLIVTPAGELVFLELNPNGQWLWIELITGAPLSEAMFRLLVQ